MGRPLRKITDTLARTLAEDWVSGYVFALAIYLQVP